MMTDSALPPDDAMAQVMLAQHHVAAAIDDMKADQVPPSLMATELMAHAIVAMLPMISLAEAREQAVQLFGNVFAGLRSAMANMPVPPGNSA